MALTFTKLFFSNAFIAKPYKTAELQSARKYIILLCVDFPRSAYSSCSLFQSIRRLSSKRTGAKGSPCLVHIEKMSRKPSIIENLEHREKILRRERERLRKLGESLHDPREADHLLREEDRLLDVVTKGKHPSPSSQISRNFKEKGAFSIGAEISALQECANSRRAQRSKESGSSREESGASRGVGKHRKRHAGKHEK